MKTDVAIGGFVGCLCQRATLAYAIGWKRAGRGFLFDALVVLADTDGAVVLSVTSDLPTTVTRAVVTTRGSRRCN